MSGIVGILGLDGAPARPAALRHMLGTIAHRGPDGLSVWTDGAIGLGHAAHWTTPEAEAESWPLVRSDSGIVLVADARIDNRAELLRSLDPSPNEGEAVTDADLIAAAYERWGLDGPVHLIGDFAFALWDEREQRLLCVRDGVGARPFFYSHQSGRRFAFGSEIKALLSHPSIDDALHENRVADFLAGISPDETATFYRNVRRLPPGHALVVTSDGLRAWRYWGLDPQKEIRYDTDAEYADAFRERFDEAVRCRLRGNAPVGAYLSGGLDSSSIAVTARTLRGDDELPLRTFSTIYDRFPSCDERSYMQAVLDRGGFDPHFFSGDDVDRLRCLGEMLAVQDGPFFAPNLATQWAELSRIRATGTAVVLDGHGGDEVVSQGRGRLHDLARSGRWSLLTHELLRGSSATGGDLRPGLGSDLLWHYGVQPWMETRPWAQRAYGWWRQVRALLPSGTPSAPPEAPASLLREEVRARLGVDDRQHRIERDRAQHLRSARGAHYFSLTGPMQGRALEILNQAASHHGVELRFPFLDRRLMEFCLALPADQKRRHGWGRYVLRRAMASRLPAAVRRRRSKVDFSAHLAAGLVREKMTLDALLLDPDEPAAAYLDASEVKRLLALLEQRGTKTPGPVLFGLWRCVVVARWM